MILSHINPTSPFLFIYTFFLSLHEYSWFIKLLLFKLVGLSTLSSCSRLTLQDKGDRPDCNNYRGIMLLSVPGKVIAHLLLM